MRARQEGVWIPIIILDDYGIHVLFIAYYARVLIGKGKSS